MQLEEAPIETPGAIGTVEEYQAPLWLAFEHIRVESDNCTTDQECLDHTIFAVNRTMGSEEPCPTLLLCSAIPSAARMSTTAQLDRDRLIDSAMKEVEGNKHE